MASYDCKLSPCTRDVCVIHGIPSARELDARRPHKVGTGYDPANPRKLCDLKGCTLHQRTKRIDSVPLSFLQQNPPIDDEVDAHKSHNHGFYDPRQHPESMNRNYYPPHLTSVPFISTWELQQVGGYGPTALRQLPPLTNLNSDRHRNRGGYDPANPRRRPNIINGIPEFDDEVMMSKRSHSVYSDDWPELEFSTPPEWYITKLIGRNRGRWDFYTPPDKDYISRVFTDEQDRENAIAAYSADARLRQNDHLPHMFMYGIRYAPKPESVQASSIETRAIIISGLDPNTKLSVLMSKVRGGKIIKINTAVFAKQLTAFIQFADTESAKSYMEHMASSSVSVNFGSGSQVSLVNSHSYPISLDLEDQLEHGCTRHLAISAMDHPQEFLKDFSQVSKTTHLEDILEDVWVDNRDILFVLFRSVAGAVRFFGRIHRQAWMAEQLKIKPSSVAFAQDPCDTPAVLAWFHGLARGSYPSLLDEWIIQGSTPGSSHTDAPAEQAPVAQQPAEGTTELGANCHDVTAALKKSRSRSELK
ncbi:hypothetical protein Hte_001143 [Hypoxylon texense]